MSAVGRCDYLTLPRLQEDVNLGHQKRNMTRLLQLCSRRARSSPVRGQSAHRLAPKHPAQLARSTSRREANSEPFIFPGRNTLERFVTGKASVSVTNKLLTRAYGNHAQLDPPSC